MKELEISQKMVEQFKTKSLEEKTKFLENYPSKFDELGDFSPELCDLAIKKLTSNIKFVSSPTEKQCVDNSSWKFKQYLFNF